MSTKLAVIPLPPEGGGTLHLASVASGFAAPVYLTTPPGDTAGS